MKKAVIPFYSHLLAIYIMKLSRPVWLCLPIFGPLFALKIKKEEKVCVEAMDQILPISELPKTDAAMEHVVTALIQIDSTFGITPCQMAALRGGLSDAGELEGGSQQVEPSAAQKTRALRDASDESQFGGHRKSDSAALNAGATAMNGLKSGLAFTVENPSEVLNMGLKGITGGINDLHIFPHLNVDIDGKWVYKSGEKIGDLASDGTFATFQFFSGIGAAISPSLAGRRRVVYDEDCDYIMDNIDAIENTCASYRYARLEQLEPAVQDSSTVNAEQLVNVTAINTTWSGDALLFNAGLRQTFSEQKEALYGINGDCLNPTKGSLAFMSSHLSKSLSEIMRNMNGEFDTIWTNLINIDNYSVNAGNVNSSALIGDGFGEILNMSVLSQKDYNRVHSQNVKRMASTGNMNLSNIANLTNSGELKLSSNLVSAQASDESLHKTYSTQLDKTLRILDALTSKLDDSPQGLSRFSDDLTSGVNTILSNANTQIRSSSKDQISGSITDAGKKMIDAFHSQSESARHSNQANWETEAKSYMFSVGQQMGGPQRKANFAAQNLSLQLNQSQATIINSLDEMSANQSIEFTSAEMVSQDSASIVRQLGSHQKQSSRTLNQVFSALNQSNQDSVQTAQEKMSQAVTVSASSVSDILASMGQDAGSMASQLQGDVNQFSAQLTEAGQRMQQLASSSTSDAQQTSSAQQSALQMGNRIAQSQTQALSDSNDIAVSSAADQWMQTGDSITDALQAAVGSNAASAAQLHRDSGGALSAMKSGVDQAKSSSQAQAMSSSAQALDTLVKTGSNLNSLARAAGNSVNANQGIIASVESSARSAGDAVSNESRQSADLASGIGDQLGSFEDQTASSLDQSYRFQSAQTGNHMDSVLSRSRSFTSKSLADLSSKVGLTTQSVDRSTGSGQSAINKGVLNNQGSQEILAQVGNSLDSISDSTDQAFNELMTSTKDQLAAASSSTASDAASFASGISGQASRLSVSAESESERALTRSTAALDPQIIGIKTGMQKLSDAKTNSDKAILDAQVRSSIETGRVGHVISDAMKFVAGSESNSLGGLDIDSESLDIVRKLKNLNSSVLANLTSLNSSFSKWNDSVVNELSSSVQDVVTSLQAKEFQIEESASKYVSSGARNNGSFSTEALGNLKQAGSSSSGFMDTLQSQQEGLDASRKDQEDRFGLFRTDIEQAKQVVSNNEFQSKTYSGFIQGEITKESNEASGLARQATQAAVLANTSLGLAANKSASDSQFRTDLYKAQAQGMVVAGNNAAYGLNNVVSEASLAVGSSVTGSIAEIGELDDSLTTHGTALKQRFRHAIRGLASTENRMRSNITMDRDQQKMQLMMAKRGIRDLLSGWANYVDVQTGKFKRMNDSDAQYTSSMFHRIDSTNETSGASLKASASNLASMNMQVLDAAEDYISFSGQVEKGLSGFQAGLEVLNKSASAGVDQMKEMIYNLDANDQFNDDSERESMQATLKQFELQLDSQAQQAEQSVPSY